ncbi:hypothetical protein BDR22DRAFT_864585 [Usnea florida]
MYVFQCLLFAAILTSVTQAGVVEKRQAVQTFATCTPAYNPRFCPNPYCVCTQPVTNSVSGTITTDNIVNVYAATSGATVCPTAGAAVSEAGCEIVVESKLDSTCGAVVFNTDLCLHSATASITLSATSTQASRALLASVSGVAQQTGSAPDSTITQGPSYKIVSGSTCVSNGVTLPTTLEPQQTCGSLTAAANCVPFAVLPWSTLDPMSASFTGCACADSWQMPSLTSVQIVQASFAPQCNPSEYSAGPWAEVSTITNTPSFYDIVPNCEKWLSDNAANPTPASNPCSGFPITSSYTASCSYESGVDALGQGYTECGCSNDSPKYTTMWFGDCPSSNVFTYKATTTIG